MKFKLLLGFLILSFSLFAQQKQLAKYYLGYRIVNSSDGQLVRFGVIRISPNGATKITYMSKINFFLQAAGKQESVANKDTINYWKTYKVNAKTVNELWKLKFSEYPFDRSSDTKGWAKLKYSASPSQLRFLSKYGFNGNITDFIYGKKAFDLLFDMQNPSWQAQYSSL